MKTYAYKGKTPRIGRNCMIADSVELIGDIEIGDNCSIWSAVIIRSDTTPVRIGNNVHIEENSNLHTSAHIEDNVIIGHRCMIEGFVGHDTLIASNATLLPMSRVGAYCTVAAGAIVADGAEMPDHSFIIGVPARVHSTIDPDNPKHMMRLSKTYIEGPRGIRTLADEYIQQRIWEHRDV